VRASGAVPGTPVFPLSCLAPKGFGAKQEKKERLFFAALPRVALVPRLPRAKKSPREKSQSQIKPLRLGLVQSPKIQNGAIWRWDQTERQVKQNSDLIHKHACFGSGNPLEERKARDPVYRDVGSKRVRKSFMILFLLLLFRRNGAGLRSRVVQVSLADVGQHRGGAGADGGARSVHGRAALATGLSARVRTSCDGHLAAYGYLEGLIGLYAFFLQRIYGWRTRCL